MNKFKIPKKTAYLIAICAFFVPCVCFAQEQITLTTYYPAPFGIYFDLHSDKIAVGSGYRAITSVPDGVLAVQNRIGINTSAPPAGERLTIMMPNGSSRFAVNNTDYVGVDLKSSGNTPYIDFSNDTSIDYDVRLILTGDDVLSVQGGGLDFALNINSATTSDTIASSGSYSPFTRYRNKTHT